jgi:hypothetical protein
MRETRLVSGKRRRQRSSWKEQGEQRNRGRTEVGLGEEEEENVRMRRLKRRMKVTSRIRE